MPFLPDFTEIDLFKDEICHTLEECGSRIEFLKTEMNELSESAESITKVIYTLNLNHFKLTKLWRSGIRIHEEAWILYYFISAM